MRHTISNLMPKEVRMMGATIPVSWFIGAARRYVSLDTILTDDHFTCDVTELVLEAITIGLERELSRTKRGLPPPLDPKPAYLRKVAANLVHEAARKSLRWHSKISLTKEPFSEDAESQMDLAETPSAEDKARFSNMVFSMFPVEELIYETEKVTNRPIARVRRK